MGTCQIVSWHIGGNYPVIRCFIVLIFILNMLIKCNRPSPQTKGHPFTQGCKHLEHFTKPGIPKLGNKNILTCRILWVMQPPRSQSIMTRLQNLILSSLPCVGCCLWTANLSLITFSVLHPQMKMKHFKKHWSTDLQVKVRDAVEEVVSFLVSLCHEIWYQSMAYSSKQCYEKLDSDLTAPAQAKKGHLAAWNIGSDQWWGGMGDATVEACYSTKVILQRLCHCSPHTTFHRSRVRLVARWHGGCNSRGMSARRGTG